LKIRCGVPGAVTVSAVADKAVSGIIKLNVKSGMKNLKLKVDTKAGPKEINIKFKKK
jgi:hypothetical protein